MIVWKVMLQAAVTGAIFGPLAGAAFGPVEMKPPPDPPWRQLPRAEISASNYDFTIDPPEDRDPPALIEAAARRLDAQFAYDTLPRPEPAPLPDPLPDPLADPQSPADENGVIVHRGSSRSVETPLQADSQDDYAADYQTGDGQPTATLAAPAPDAALADTIPS